ncbi:MAG: ribonuclease III [Campylobacterales bacterium]
MSDVKNFQKLLGYEFKDSDLLQSALTHKSYTRVKNNERLEFLGDAVIDLLIGEYLFLKFPKHKEGQLSKMRASLVSEKSLFRYAQKVELGEHIYLSVAEDNNKGREKPSILSSAFEAIIGAVYLESGIEVCREILYILTEKIYPNIDFDSVFSDYKTTLQEVTQAHFGTIPEYILQKTSGPDHQKEFEISVVIEGRVYATQSGNSKKDAQQKAAQLALMELNKELNE